MNLSRLKKTTFFAATVFIATASFFLYSCQKEISGGGITLPSSPADLTTKVVASSVSGFVTDENEAAVNGASVKIGGTITTTNKYGYFEIKDVEIVKNAGLVTVSKTGYFKGIKTFIGATGKAAFFRIKLIPKNIAGTFDAAAGGAVTLPNGLSVALPTGAVVNATTNAAYTGNVNVAAYWISPTAADLVRIMPGDLRGLDSLNVLKSLTTYGMAAVELTGAAGELLQIAPGKKATLTFPIPNSIAASAPVTIPLWYFDETLGLWKQEGSAAKLGTTYVGSVSHFSFWNCDVPANYVQFNCTVVNTGGTPMANVWVKLSVVSNPQNARWALTDTSGYVAGLVPDNSQLLLEVFSEYNCGSPAISQTFTTTGAPISLGNIIISASSTVATITGTVTNCNGTAVTNGYVLMKKGYANYRIPVSSTGTFNYPLTICNSSVDVTFIAEDITTLQSGSVTNFTLVTGTNTIGVLNACGNSINQFFNYTINGTAYTNSYPIDSISHFMRNNTSMTVSASSLNSGSFMNNGTLSFIAAGISSGSTQQLTNFTTSNISDSIAITSPILVNITEYGSVGGFIAGNFTGAFTGAPPANTVYNTTCTFRVRRAF